MKCMDAYALAFRLTVLPYEKWALVSELSGLSFGMEGVLRRSRNILQNYERPQ